jgi:hypothetical protein
LALVISLYLLADGPRYHERSLALIPAQHRAKALFLQDWLAVLGGDRDHAEALVPFAETLTRS